MEDKVVIILSGERRRPEPAFPVAALASLLAADGIPTGFGTRYVEPVRPAGLRPGTKRNDKCPCGSGKKYKKCCVAGVRRERPAVAKTRSVRPDVSDS